MLLSAFRSPIRTPLLLAGAVALAAPLAFYLASPAAPEPTAASVAPPAHGESETRSYAYYPEQLAALSSLSSFSPVADPGQPPSATAPVKETPAARHPVRPAEARRVEPRAAARRIEPLAATRAAAPEHREEGWKVFGLALPKPGWPDGKALREKAEGWRDAAASLPDKALALGAGVTRLWRAPAADAGREKPAREN